MLCKIADLIVDVPVAGGMPPRCTGYEISKGHQVAGIDISICTDQYRYSRYPRLDECGVAYMESGFQFCKELLRYNGFYLHASAVAIDGRAYLFSGPCGMGKSTHTRLWQSVFKGEAIVFNDDKPALRRLEECWYAYGTPWCGKDGININMKVPLAGICFLQRGEENRIRRLNGVDAISFFLMQTIRNQLNHNQLNLLLENLDKLVREIPIFELQNRPEPEAAMLSYETMCRAAEEAGL